MKSHRKIEGETLTSVKKAKMNTVEGAQKLPDSLHPTIITRVTVKYRNFKQKIKNKVHNMATNKAGNIIRKRLGDGTWYGKLIFAILDVLPLPNLHEVWKAVQKELPDAPFKDKLKLFWTKIDGFRTVVAIAVALVGYYQL